MTQTPWTDVDRNASTDPEPMFRCSRCKNSKPRSEFHKDPYTPKTRDGVSYMCKLCKNAQMQKAPSQQSKPGIKRTMTIEYLKKNIQRFISNDELAALKYALIRDLGFDLLELPVAQAPKVTKETWNHDDAIAEMLRDVEQRRNNT